MKILTLLSIVVLAAGNLDAETHTFVPTVFYNTYSFAHPPALHDHPGDPVAIGAGAAREPRREPVRRRLDPPRLAVLGVNRPAWEDVDPRHEAHMPRAAAGGNEVVVRGFGLSGVTAVEFGALPATFTVDDDRQLRAVAPRGTPGTRAPLALTTATGRWVMADLAGPWAAGAWYGFAGPPVIRRLDPPYGFPGRVVEIRGDGLSVVTEATVRLLPLPEAVRTTLALFASVEAASEAVSGLIGRGIVPSALEMMDRLALSAIEAAFHAGYPPEAGAVLLVEVDGLLEQVEAQAAIVDDVCRGAGALEMRLAVSEEDRARLWAARKGAASAMGRIAPNYYLHDAVVPRTKLPSILGHVVEIGQRYDLPIANLFHAGDGNLHPMILFDAREPGILERVMAAGREILGRCVEVGGTITGEHGVGLEKQGFMSWIFSEDDLRVMAQVRSAIDPSGCFNPAKVLPSPDVAHGLPASTAAHARIPEGMWV